MKKNTLAQKGRQSYEMWKKGLDDNPDYRAVYEEEAAKKELWLQLIEARQAAGFTQQKLAQRLGVSQAQVARMEKRGYDAYTLTSLRKYIKALGKGFSLKVTVEEPRMHSSFSN